MADIESAANILRDFRHVGQIQPHNQTVETKNSDGEDKDDYETVLEGLQSAQNEAEAETFPDSSHLRFLVPWTSGTMNC